MAVQTTNARIGDGATVVALGDGAGLAVVTGYQGSFSPYGASNSTSVLPPSSSGVPTGASVTSNGSAEIDPTSVADALNEGGSLLFLNRTKTPEENQVNGVIVDATSTNVIRSLSIGAAGGGSAAVAISGDVPVVVSDTEATVGAGAQINTTGTAKPSQSVTVAAASDLYHLGVDGSVAGGGSVGVGVGAEMGSVGRTP